LGTEQLLWATSGIDLYVGYHGTAQGQFAIDWPMATGTDMDLKKQTSPTTAALTTNAKDKEPSAADPPSFHMTMLSWKGTFFLWSLILGTVGFL